MSSSPDVARFEQMLRLSIEAALPALPPDAATKIRKLLSPGTFASFGAELATAGTDTDVAAARAVDLLVSRQRSYPALDAGDGIRRWLEEVSGATEGWIAEHASRYFVQSVRAIGADAMVAVLTRCVARRTTHVAAPLIRRIAQPGSKTIARADLDPQQIWFGQAEVQASNIKTNVAEIIQSLETPRGPKIRTIEVIQDDRPVYVAWDGNHTLMSARRAGLARVRAAVYAVDQALRLSSPGEMERILGCIGKEVRIVEKFTPLG